MRIEHVLDILASRGSADRLDAIRDLVGRAADGEAAGLDLRGQAGMGKTRLYQAAIQEAARIGVHVVGFRLSLAEARSEGVSFRLVEKIRQAAPDDAAFEPPAIEPETPTDRGYPRPEATILAVRDAVLAFTRNWPLLIAIDNLHLAGRTMLRAVREALAAVEDNPTHGLAVLVTTSGDPATGSSLNGLESLHPLEPLTASEIAIIAKASIGDIPETAVEAVLDLSKGNLHWVREILSHLGTVGAPLQEAEAIVRGYDPSSWGRGILADLSDDAHLVMQAVAQLGRVESVAVEQLARILELPDERVLIALDEASEFLHEKAGRWNVLHELDRDAVCALILPPDTSRWHARAAICSSSALAAAMHVRATAQGSVDNEVEMLRAGARDGAIDECIALLTEAAERADPAVGAEIARELAALYLYGLGDFDKALAQLSLRPPNPEEESLAFVDWQELKFRALSRQPGRSWSVIEAELRNAAAQLPATADHARKRLLAVRAGKAWMSIEERNRIRAELDAIRLPERGTTADDARLLFAAAEHLAIDGGPAISQDSGVPTVLGLLKRCIDGPGLWDASISLRPMMICDVQWLLLCCDAYTVLEGFERDANVRLAHTSPSAHAFHRALVAHRLIGFGRLEEALLIVMEAIKRVPDEFRQLPVAIAVDALVELGRIADADRLLAESFPPDSGEQVTDWRLMIAQARVSGNMLRIEHAIERLAAVGTKRAEERRRAPTFAWRVDLLRLLRRFRFPAHPESSRWQRLLEPAIRAAAEASGDAVAQQLLADELRYAEAWGTPTPLARAHRAAGEVWAGIDLPRARHHREQAVGLLTKLSVSAEGAGQLEYARSVYELAQQFREEATQATDDAARGLRRLAAENAAHAGELALKMGAAQLWINAWDMHSTQGRSRSAMKPVRDARIPFLSPDATLVSELAASGLTTKQITELLHGKSSHVVNQQLSRLRRLLLDEEEEDTVAAGKLRAGTETDSTSQERRRNDWLLFRRLQHQRFREMRERALANEGPSR